jgi:hypothetical protein
MLWDSFPKGLQIIIMVEVAAHTIFEVLILHLASDITFMIGATNIPRRKQWLVASIYFIFFLEYWSLRSVCNVF